MSTIDGQKVHGRHMAEIYRAINTFVDNLDLLDISDAAADKTYTVPAGSIFVDAESSENKIGGYIWRTLLVPERYDFATWDEDLVLLSQVPIPKINAAFGEFTDPFGFTRPIVHGVAGHANGFYLLRLQGGITLNKFTPDTVLGMHLFSRAGSILTTVEIDVSAIPDVPPGVNAGFPVSFAVLQTNPPRFFFNWVYSGGGSSGPLVEFDVNGTILDFQSIAGFINAHSAGANSLFDGRGKRVIPGAVGSYQLCDGPGIESGEISSSYESYHVNTDTYIGSRNASDVSEHITKDGVGDEKFRFDHIPSVGSISSGFLLADVDVSGGHPFYYTDLVAGTGIERKPSASQVILRTQWHGHRKPSQVGDTIEGADWGHFFIGEMPANDALHDGGASPHQRDVTECRTAMEFFINLLYHPTTGQKYDTTLGSAIPENPFWDAFGTLGWPNEFDNFIPPGPPPNHPLSLESLRGIFVDDLNTFKDLLVAASTIGKDLDVCT